VPLHVALTVSASRGGGVFRWVHAVIDALDEQNSHSSMPIGWGITECKQFEVGSKIIDGRLRQRAGRWSSDTLPQTPRPLASSILGWGSGCCSHGILMKTHLRARLKRWAVKSAARRSGVSWMSRVFGRQDPV